MPFLNVRVGEGCDLLSTPDGKKRSDGEAEGSSSAYFVYMTLSIIDEERSKVSSFMTKGHLYTDGVLHFGDEEYCFDHNITPLHQLQIVLHVSNCSGSICFKECLGMFCISLFDVTFDNQEFTCHNFYSVDDDARKLKSCVSLRIRFEEANEDEVSRDNSTISESESHREIKLDEEKERYPSGIIDCFVLVGPSSFSYNGKPQSSPSISSYKSFFKSKINGSFSSPHSSLNSSDVIKTFDTNEQEDDLEISRRNLSFSHSFEVDYISGIPEDHTSVELIESDYLNKTLIGTALYTSICIWDKYPAYDQLNQLSHIPDKLEWFAFPNGVEVLIQAERPGVKTQCFILQAVDQIQYGICLKFFLRGDETILDQSATSRNYEWIGVSLCALTSNVFVCELNNLMKSLYNSEILPVLLEREKQLDNKERLFPLSLNIDAIMHYFCFQAPLPLPDVLTTKYILKSGHLLTMSVPSDHKLPPCVFSIYHCFQYFGPRVILDLLYHVFAENKILIHSYDEELLPLLCETLRTLMYPLQWTGVYIPIMPCVLLDVLEAPVPFIVGITTNSFQEIDPSLLRNLVILDCNTGLLNQSADIVFKFPNEYDRWCIHSWKILLQHIEGEIFEAEEGYSSETTVSIDYNFQSIMFDIMLHVFSWLPECIFNAGTSFPAFNSALFLEYFCPVEFRDFLKVMMGTQALSRLINKLNSKDSNFFVSAATKFKKNGFSWISSDSIMPGSIFYNNIVQIVQQMFTEARKGDSAFGKLLFPSCVYQYHCEFLKSSAFKIDSPEFLYYYLQTRPLEVINLCPESENAIYLRDFNSANIIPDVKVENGKEETGKPLESPSIPILKRSSLSELLFPPLRLNSIFSSERKVHHRLTVNEIRNSIEIQHYNNLIDNHIVSPKKGRQLADINPSQLFLDSFHIFNLKLENKRKLQNDLHAYNSRFNNLQCENCLRNLLLNVMPCFELRKLSLTALDSLLDECKDLFNKSLSRSRLVSILQEFSIQLPQIFTFEQQNKIETRNCSDYIQRQVGLLPVSFNLLCKICEILLAACKLHSDFVSAFRLLEVSKFFSKLPSIVDDLAAEYDSSLTLQNNIIKSSIFQQTNFWRTSANFKIAEYQSQSAATNKPLGGNNFCFEVTTLFELAHLVGASFEDLSTMMFEVAIDFGIQRTDFEWIWNKMNEIWKCKVELPKGAEILNVESTHCPQTIKSIIANFSLQIKDNSQVYEAENPDTSTVDEFSSTSSLLEINLNGSEVLNDCVTCVQSFDNFVISGHSDGTLNLIDLVTGRVVQKHARDNPIVTAAMVSSGTVLSADAHGILQIWLPQTSKSSVWYKLRREAFSIVSAFSGNVKLTSCSISEFKDAVKSKWLMAIGSDSGIVKLFSGNKDAVNGADEALAMEFVEIGGVSSISLYTADSHSPFGRSDVNRKIPGAIYVGSTDGNIAVIDINSRVAVFKSSKNTSHSALVSTVQSVRSFEIVSGGYDRMIKIWDLRTPAKPLTLEGGRAPISRVLNDELNDSILISSSADSIIRVWDTRYPSLKAPYLTFRGHLGRISDIGQCGNTIVSASYDGTVKLWDRNSGESTGTLRDVARNPVLSVSILQQRLSLSSSLKLINSSEMNQYSLNTIGIVVGYADGKVKVWNSSK